MYDINGDGLVDRVMMDGGKTWMNVQLNTGLAGQGFGPVQVWSNDVLRSYGEGITYTQYNDWAVLSSSEFIGMYDINGDGLVDLV